MFPHSNVHTHTNFSDGRDSAEQMVRTAIARGFTSLGFSDHGAMTADPAGMRSEAAYRAEILRLKQVYADQIEIALGYEHDFCAAHADLSPYEYVIESVHFLHKDGVYAPIDSSAAKLQRAIDELYGGDPFAMCRDYFDSVCRSMEVPGIDIVGHIGLVTKYNENNAMFDASDDRYLKPALECIDRAVERDLIVEINTGAISRGYRTQPYPDLPVLKHLRERGGRITITSDCHRDEWIDFAFDKAVAAAKAAGFQETYVLKQNRFVPIPLAESANRA